MILQPLTIQFMYNLRKSLKKE